MKKKVCEGRISSPFGYRIHPITKEKKFHNGVDIACPIGTPILSPANCIIVQVYTHDAGGKSMILRDVDTNDRYGFCHLSEQLIKVGTKVSRGSVIAKSGNTGHTTGPHLHYTYSTGGYWKEGKCYGCEFSNPVTKIEFEQ